MSIRAGLEKVRLISPDSLPVAVAEGLMEGLQMR